MFDDVRDEAEDRRRLRDRVAALTRHRGFRLMAAVACTGALLVAISVGWVYAQVRPVHCEPFAVSDLSIEEMIAIKRRVEQYERDPSAPLTLNGREASFLLADNMRYPVRVALDGTEVEAELAVPQRGTERCYNIDFRGKVTIDEGVARVVPSRLTIGELDLSGWLAGTQLVVEDTDLSGEHARRLLSRTRHLEVIDSHLLVQIDDMRSFR